MNVDREDFARKLFIKGWNDLDSARNLMGVKRPATDVICFHCQQAAEKFLKAWLVLNGVQPPKTHNLTEIINICVKIDPDLSQISHVDALTPYAVEVRYADDFYLPPIEETLNALNLANQAEAFIKGKLEDMGLSPLEGYINEQDGR